MGWKVLLMELRVKLGWRVETGEGGRDVAEDGEGVTGKMRLRVEVSLKGRMALRAEVELW